MKNSRWTKGAVRYSNERKVESTRYVKNKRGQWVLKSEDISEHAFVHQRLHSGSTAFARGARVYRVAV